MIDIEARKASNLLTDAELSDPEYMLNYIEGCHDTVQSFIDRVKELENDLYKMKLRADIYEGSCHAYKEQLAARAGQEPIGYITTGGVVYTNEGVELGDWDINWEHKVIDVMPEFAEPNTTYGVFLRPLPPTQDNALENGKTSGYITTVPDKSDRIVWQGNYYHLPIDRLNIVLAAIDSRIVEHESKIADENDFNHACSRQIINELKDVLQVVPSEDHLV